jgi:hypothetical protein
MAFIDRDYSSAPLAESSRARRCFNDTGQREIHVRPYPGPGGKSPVSVSGGREPRWAANGEIFYRSMDGTQMFSAKATVAAAG